MRSTISRRPIWRPRSPHPWGNRAVSAAKALRIGQIVIVELSGEKVENRADDSRIVDPGPVAGPGDDLERGAWQGSSVGLAEARLEEGIVGTPEDQGRTGQAVEVFTRLGETSRVGVAVEGERGLVGSVVHVVPDHLDELRRHRPAV